MGTYKMLSLDGGGCRGVVSAVLIEALAERVPHFLDRVDLFAGTSIGAANALAYATGRDPQTMVDFYRSHGRDLFSERMRPKGLLGVLGGGLSLIPGVRTLVDRADSLFLPKWSNDGLRRSLRGYFGETRTLGELGSKRVVLPALALDGKLRYSTARVVLPMSIHNFPSSAFLEQPIHDIALRSMSAPTYFESAEGYVDGGVFANNPAIAAVTTAVSMADHTIEDIRMLSIGTGISPDAIQSRGPLKWGILKWGSRFPEIAMRAVSEFGHLQCRAILPREGYFRLNLELPRNVPMDDVAAIPELEAIARKAISTKVFDAAASFLEEHFR